MTESVSAWSSSAATALSTICDVRWSPWCFKQRTKLVLIDSILRFEQPESDSLISILDIRDALFIETRTRRKLRVSYIPGATYSNFALQPSRMKEISLTLSSLEEANSWRLKLLSIARPDLAEASQGRGSPVLPPLIVFINPLGGQMRGRLVWRLQVRPLLDKAGRSYREVVTKRRGEISDTCANLDSETCSGVIVVGGDGSAAEAANGLTKRRRVSSGSLPLCVVPCGSSNALAKALGVFSPALAAFYLIKNIRRSIDGIRLSGEPAEGSLIETELALCAVSLGFLSDVNLMSQGRIWRQLLGPARYGLCGARRILCGGSIANYEAEIEIKRLDRNVEEEENRHTGEGRAVEASTGSWDILSPDLWSKNGNAKFAGPGLVLAAHDKTFSVLRFLNKFSTANFSDALQHVQPGIDTIEITPFGRSASLPFSIDGELLRFRRLKLELAEDVVTVFAATCGYNGGTSKSVTTGTGGR